MGYLRQMWPVRGRPNDAITGVQQRLRAQHYSMNARGGDANTCGVGPPAITFQVGGDRLPQGGNSEVGAVERAPIIQSLLCRCANELGCYDIRLAKPKGNHAAQPRTSVCDF